MIFEWDPKKAAINLRKHKVSFKEAATVFNDPFSVTVADPDHSIDENRYLIIGQSSRHRLLIVSHAEQAERVRLISARELTPTEREAYEEEAQDRNA